MTFMRTSHLDMTPYTHCKPNLLLAITAILEHFIISVTTPNGRYGKRVIIPISAKKTQAIVDERVLRRKIITHQRG